MDLYKVTVIETVERTFEIAIRNSKESPWDVAKKIYEQDHDKLQPAVTNYNFEIKFLDSY